MEKLPALDGNQWSYDLVALNYRQLQSRAKELELPGNLKHEVLMEVIKARCSGNEDLVKKIIANEREVRARKKAAKKLLQNSSYQNPSSPHSVTPQIKRVGRPRKKSLDDSFSSHHSRKKSTEDFENRRTLSLPFLGVASPGHCNSMPMAHSIQQLLMDRSVPNAATKQRNQKLTLTPTSNQTHRYKLKSVHCSVKDTSGGQVFQDTSNWQMTKPWENSTNGQINTGGNILTQSFDYSNLRNFQPNYISQNTQQNMAQFSENGDLNTSSEYIPDLDGLLGNNLPFVAPQSNGSQLHSTDSPNYPPIFLRQDLWPYQDGNYQSTSGAYAASQSYHDYTNWPVWNSTQYAPYLSNPTTGYFEEVVISETQNSDTMSAPENPDLIPPPSSYTGSSLLPEDNDKQLYWPRADGSSSLTTASSLSSCSVGQIHNNNIYEKSPTEKGGLSHMRVSVVDTQEWTYEYSTSSGIFSQPFLQHY